MFNILSRKNLDKLILSYSDSTNGSVRIKNVENDSNSGPTDAVNISYMKRWTREEVEKFVRALNFDKLVLAPSETNGHLFALETWLQTLILYLATLWTYPIWRRIYVFLA